MIINLGQGTKVDGDAAWKEGFPWLIAEATEFIEAHLPKKARIFEWGSGGSTVWFSRGDNLVASAETNSEWAKCVRERLDQDKIGNFTMILDFGPADSEHMRAYEFSINLFPKDYFDFILVDGRSRVRCLGNAMTRVRPGGFICLDNSERSRYKDGIALFQKWDGWQWGYPDWTTTIWQRPG